MKILGIIPARYGSTRLPGKPLIKVKGKTIIERVYERVKLSRYLDEIIVATDDVRILNHVRKFGGRAALTSQVHPSGTYRCGEVALRRDDFDLILNIQGDEPLINPVQIDQMAMFMMENRHVRIGTLIKRIDMEDELHDPSVVKVVTGIDQQVLYFSRSAIPHQRNEPRQRWFEQYTYMKHIGLYAYYRETLMELVNLDRSPLERAEMLEQLNWLYHGYPIYALETEIESIGIDTPADLELLHHILSLADKSSQKSSVKGKRNKLHY